MCVLKCFKYKIKNNIIIKIFILMAYFIHKYMFKNTKAIHWLVRFQNDFIWGCTHFDFVFFCFCFVFQERRRKMLQICQPPSFVSNSLSIPFPKDRRQVFLDCHLLSVAAVAVCEDPIWVSLGEGLWAVIQHFPPAVGETRGGFHYQHTDTWCIHKTHPYVQPVVLNLFCLCFSSKRKIIV